MDSRHTARFEPPTSNSADSAVLPSAPIPLPAQLRSDQTNGDPAAACDKLRFERPLSDQEISYYLPSRQDGANDMYMHLGVVAPPEIMDIERVRVAWAIHQVRHPLLVARVDMRDYDDIRFVYEAPRNREDALERAWASMQVYRYVKTKDELIAAFLNGRRILSDDKLSTLIISEPPLPPEVISANGDAPKPDGPLLQTYDIIVCATHFTGDGFSMYRTQNDLFVLLGGGVEGKTSTLEELEAILETEIDSLRRDGASPLPLSMEAQLCNSTGTHKFRDAAHKTVFSNYAKRQIGGHVFPRKSNPTRHIIANEQRYSTVETTRLLKLCKFKGVSIGNVIFALASIAWANMSPNAVELPMMFYSAGSTRPYLAPQDSKQSYFFLSISHFNLIFPAFLPTSDNPNHLVNMIWHRARSSKAQCTKWGINKMLIPRAISTARERVACARKWAKADDSEVCAEDTVRPATTADPTLSDQTAAVKTVSASEETPVLPPSLALAGLSMIGDMDKLFHHNLYPSIDIKTHMAGVRQRSGAILFFASTLKGTLHLNLHWDEGTLEAEPVQIWWKGIVDGLDAL